MKSLERNWLAVELQSVDAEIDRWSDGLKDSFKSLSTDYQLREKDARQVDGSASTESIPFTTLR